MLAGWMAGGLAQVDQVRDTREFIIRCWVYWTAAPRVCSEQIVFLSYILYILYILLYCQSSNCPIQFQPPPFRTVYPPPKLKKRRWQQYPLSSAHARTKKREKRSTSCFCHAYLHSKKMICDQSTTAFQPSTVVTALGHDRQQGVC